MQQLRFPFKTDMIQSIVYKAKNALAYVAKHPGDLILAVMLVMLIDIENDLENLNK
jgi:hypothetical protein